jgi:hypothetical protein
MTMIHSLTILVLFIGLFATTDAWVLVSPRPVHVQASALFSAHPEDSSAARLFFAEALRISNEFGAASEEAKMAWETVKEMDEDSSDVVAPALGQAAANPPLSVEEMNKLDYANQVSELSYLLQDTREKIAQMRVLTYNIKQLELKGDSSSLKTALAEAKAAKEVHGASSPEAVKAWEEVQHCADSINGGGGYDEECHVDSMYRYSKAGLKAHHYYNSVIDAMFLQEAVEAMDTVDSLRRFIQIENNWLKNGRGRPTP